MTVFLEEHNKHGSLIREVVLGTQDGIVSILGFTMGASAALGSTQAVGVTGLVALLTSASSFFFSQYNASKSQKEYREKEIKIQREHLRDSPQMELDELKTIYRLKGFHGKKLESIVNRISSDEQVWLKTMERESLVWLPPRGQEPFLEATVTWLSMVIGGSIPLLPFFLLPSQAAEATAITASTIVLFLLGAAKTSVTGRNWLKSGLKMLAIGATSAIIGHASGIAASGIK